MTNLALVWNFVPTRFALFHLCSVAQTNYCLYYVCVFVLLIFREIGEKLHCLRSIIWFRSLYMPSDCCYWVGNCLICFVKSRTIVHYRIVHFVVVSIILLFPILFSLDVLNRGKNSASGVRSIFNARWRDRRCLKSFWWKFHQ